MSNNDGRVIINIDSNAPKAAQDFNALDRAVKKTDTDTKAFSGSVNVLKNALGAIGVGYATSQLVNLGKSAVNTSMDFQALVNRMNAAAGNKSIGADSLAYIREQADRLGLEFRTTADSFAGFEAAALRSGLTLEQTKQKLGFSKEDKSAFLIGLQKPFESHQEVVGTLNIHDLSVVSSGIYERYFRVDGTLYHHILNPKTGYPYNNHLLAVTILSDKSVDGDALSTVTFSLGLEEGTKLIESLPNTYAAFITEDGTLHYTKGFEQFLKK